MFQNLRRTLPLVGCILGGAIGTSVAVVGVGVIVVVTVSLFLAVSTGWFLYRLGKR